MLQLADIKFEIDRHIKRVDALLPEMQKYIFLQKIDFENIENVKTIDSFIYRFSKIQDKMGEKLFPAVLDKLQEYKPNMSLVDVLHKLEKIELIISADMWIDFRKLRNELTHDYPNNETEIVEAIMLAVPAYHAMKIIYFKMLDVILRNQ